VWHGSPYGRFQTAVVTFFSAVGVSRRARGASASLYDARGQYYETCGFKETNRLSKKWQEKIAEEQKVFNEFSRKTIDVERFDSHLANYVSVYDEMWRVKLEKKRARQSLRVHVKKQKVLDNFFQSMQAPGQIKPMIAYGKANFGSGGKGEVSVPTEYVKKVCKTYYNTAEVDEFRTSSVCPSCDELLCKVIRRCNAAEKGEFREIRGLRRCCSTVCSRTSFKNRDSIGARNILRCATEAERPKRLTRNPGQGKMKLKSFILRCSRNGQKVA
jgi:hypothetical protein